MRVRCPRSPRRGGGEPGQVQNSQRVSSRPRLSAPAAPLPPPSPCLLLVRRVSDRAAAAPSDARPAAARQRHSSLPLTCRGGEARSAAAAVVPPVGFGAAARPTRCTCSRLCLWRAHWRFVPCPDVIVCSFHTYMRIHTYICWPICGGAPQIGASTLRPGTRRDAENKRYPMK